MRRILLSLTMAATTGSLQAGVYNLDAPRKFPSDYVETHLTQPMALVLSYLDELRAIHDLAVNPNDPPKSDSLRVRYELQLRSLEAKRKDGALNAVDRVNLSACLIRLGRNPTAQEVLEESLRSVPSDDPYRVLLLLNLAAIYQEDDSLMQRGIELQREALESWPKLLLGWSRGESDWYRHVEEYALSLMIIRNRETIRQGGRPPLEQPAPDKLFPREESDPAKKVRFIGPSDEYEAGGIAWKEWDRLPADAEQIVLQLLLWRPHDMRLLWQYGELLNARGLVDWAYYILNIRLRVNSQWRNRELDQHLRVLGPADKVYKVLFADNNGSSESRSNRALLLWQLVPRGSSLMSGVGEACYEIGGMALATNSGNDMGMVSPLNAAPPAAPTSMALPDWRPLTVSFVTGIVVAILGVLQWQQWRRRRSSIRGEPAT